MAAFRPLYKRTKSSGPNMHSELCGPGQQSGCLFFFYLKLFWTSSSHLNKSEGNGFYTYTCYDLTTQHIQQFICWRREGIAVLFSFLRVTSFFFSNLFKKKKGIAWASAFSSRPSHNWLNSTDHIAADKSNSPLFVSKKKKREKRAIILHRLVNEKK